MPGEEYELQASVESDYPVTNTKSFMFSTLGDTPTNESLNENGVMKDSAKAMVKVHSPDGMEHMVHLRCRELGESGWTPMTPEMTTDLEVTFDLTNLKEDTLYEMQAALNNSFDADSVLSRVFATRGGSTTTTTTTTGGGGGGGGGFGPAPVAPKFATASAPRAASRRTRGPATQSATRSPQPTPTTLRSPTPSAERTLHPSSWTRRRARSGSRRAWSSS